MAKGNDSQSEMACARQTDCINVIFDKNSPVSSPSRCGSSISCESDRSSDSVDHRGRGSNRNRSSSSSSSSSSRSPRSRSRSHPRCHRPSSRCRCNNHFRHGRGRRPSSPPRRYRARSRSCSRSPLTNSDSSRRQNRSRSRSPRRWSRYSKAASHSLQSSSRTSERSDSLSVDDKRELLKAAYANSMKILGVDNLDLPESVKPILPKHLESKPVSPEPGTRVTQNPMKTLAQMHEEESEDVPSLKLCQKGKISFSINNSVVKPTVIALSCAKVTPRMDSYESRKPYGHWVPVKSGRSSKASKRHLAKSH
ncbi:arginine/serine-rich protein 1 [Labrus mixtus]|uniref:arginine/serine-rich protein 1 n=1 Tax=Labrus mixtus TaxID=508554 RepID=UPI0029C05D9A|nr:arginine/serine-rich protein 1 [Labrus mixtus]